jgi:20S proteasome alpha/beta subunit
VTICAAAICKLEEQEVILAISDRMITSGDIEFEGTQTKIFQFRPWVFALGAGDHAVHSAISFETEQGITSGQYVEPTVRNVARLYAQNFAALRREQAEQKFLIPLGLDCTTFVSKQKSIRPELVLRLADGLLEENLDITTLILGVDPTGPHMYVVGDPGTVTCLDGAGFAAIGSGGRQARSSFMFAGYTRQWPFDRALLQLYQAKRQAEVAPGVGRATDILCLGCGEWVLRINEQDNQPLMRFLDESYRETNDKSRVCAEQIIQRMNNQFKINIQAGGLPPPAEEKESKSTEK